MKKLPGAFLVISSLVLSAACASSAVNRTPDPYMTNPEPGWGLKNKQIETQKESRGRGARSQSEEFLKEPGAERRDQEMVNG